MNKNYNARSYNTVSLICLALAGLVALSGCGGGGSDDPVINPVLSINSPTVTEGDSGTAELLFTITLSEDAASALTVDYTTADDTATVEDGDYTAADGQLTITAGSRTASVSVFVNGDDDFEQNETVNLEISNPQGLALSENSITGTGLINNDDDADPKGYFAGSGTFNGTDYNDVTAMVYGGRILLFSPSANLLYDIAITSTVFDYNGTVEVYEDGLIGTETVTVSGTTNELQITGTFAGGSGFGAGSFDVVFDVDNNRGATLERIEGTTFNRWEGALYGIDTPDTGIFSSNASGGYFGGDLTDERCLFRQNISTFAQLGIPNNAINIYQLDHSIVPDVIGSCSPPYESTGHTGFASVVDDVGTDDKLFFVFNNGNIALFGIMNK